MAAMRFCLLLFCLSLASVSSVRKLTSIEELRNTRYANRSPRHGLPLLFWFAQNVNLDQNNNMRLNFFLIQMLMDSIILETSPPLIELRTELLFCW